MRRRSRVAGQLIMIDEQVDFCRTDASVGITTAKAKCNGFSDDKVKSNYRNGESNRGTEEPAKADASRFNFVSDCGREFSFTEVDVESQELIEKISGEKCLKCNGYTLFRSFPTFLKDFLNLEVRDDDVWVCSFPRSGTHWTLEMVWCILNDLDLGTAKSTPLHFRCPYVELSALRFAEDLKLFFKLTNETRPLGVDLVRQTKSPRTIWCHLPFDLLPLQLQRRETNAKIVYVVRDVRDVCVSDFNFFRNAKTYSSFEVFCQMFLKGDVLNGPYWKHVLSYRKQKSNGNLLIIEYENMLKNLANVISKVGSFLGKNLLKEDVEKLCEHLSLENMRNNPMINTNLANFYKKLQKKEVVGDVIRAGRSGQWKETMTPKIQEAFQKEIDYYSKFD